MKKLNKNIEELLINDGIKAPEINIKSIKRTHAQAPIENSLHQQKKAKNVKFMRAIALVWCLAIIMIIPLAVVGYMKSNTVLLYVEAVDSYCLTVSSDGKVHEIQKNGETIGESVKHTVKYMSTCMISSAALTVTGIESDCRFEIADAVNGIMTDMKADGQLDGCEVVISTVCKNQSHGDAVAEQAKDTILSNSELELNEDMVICAGNSKNVCKNTSPAKSKYLESIDVDSTGYTEEELEALPTGFLKYLANKADGADTDGKTQEKINQKVEKFYEKFEKKNNENGKTEETNEKQNNGKSNNGNGKNK